MVIASAHIPLPVLRLRLGFSPASASRERPQAPQPRGFDGAASRDRGLSEASEMQRRDSGLSGLGANEATGISRRASSLSSGELQENTNEASSLSQSIPQG